METDPIRRGATQVGTGTGFAPFERVTGEQRSTPLSLGVETADADGRVVFEWTIGATNELGQHRFVLTGEVSGTIETTFTVIAAAQPPVTQPPVTQPPANRPPATRPRGPLPNTGWESGSFLPIAALLVVAGGAAVMLSLRRRQDA